MAERQATVKQIMKLVKRIGEELRQVHGDARLPDYMRHTPLQRRAEEAIRGGFIK